MDRVKKDDENLSSDFSSLSSSELDENDLKELKVELTEGELFTREDELNNE